MRSFSLCYFPKCGFAVEAHEGQGWVGNCKMAQLEKEGWKDIQTNWAEPFQHTILEKLQHLRNIRSHHSHSLKTGFSDDALPIWSSLSHSLLLNPWEENAVMNMNAEAQKPGPFTCHFQCGSEFPTRGRVVWGEMAQAGPGGFLRGV